jgi:hypothetical protein
MKRFAILAVAAALSAGAAYADHPITVMAPKDPSSKEQATVYVAELDSAVRKVCYRAAAPVVGPAYFQYLACVKATRADVEKRDPTGLYALRESKQSTVLAAR